MASFFDRFRNLITKNAQQTADEYNKAIYNWLGESIVWNPENDTTYINEGYRKNATVYSLVNIIAKAASSIPFQVYEKELEEEEEVTVDPNKETETQDPHQVGPSSDDGFGNETDGTYVWTNQEIVTEGVKSYATFCLSNLRKTNFETSQ